MKVLFIFLLSIVYTTISAQNIHITIIADNNPLPYSCVYLNGKPLGTADEKGVMHIPLNSLKTGDSLSASFVGFTSEIITYKTSEKTDYTIKLSMENTLDEAIIQAYSYNFLKKHVDMPKSFDINKAYEMEFELYRKNKSKSKGSIKLAFSPRLDFGMRYKCLDINTNDDTTGIIQPIGVLTAFAVHLTRSFSYEKNPHKGNFISYRGISKNSKVFLLSSKNAGLTIQFLLYVDKNTKKINRIKYSRINNNQIDLHYNILYTNDTNRLIINGYSFETSDMSISVKNVKETDYKEIYNLFYPKKEKRR